MSFRKRNAVIQSSRAVDAARLPPQKLPPAGTRLSPVDGRLTTSTGNASLDQLLAGHAGLALGTSLLIEETGTTDFAGTLLRYYTAEGLVQGHHVHLFGDAENWQRELPGLVSEAASKPDSKPSSSDRMKIAWRYETFGSASASGKDAFRGSASTSPDAARPFCHNFHLTERLLPSSMSGQLNGFQGDSPASHGGLHQLATFVQKLDTKLEKAPKTSVHRIVVPGLLTPTQFGSAASQPWVVLQFLHSLRGLLRRYATQLTAMVTLPLTLYPRGAGLTRWMELLFDGVIELQPLRHQSSSMRREADEDKTQGLLRLHSLPIFHEKGGGPEGSWTREDMSFKLSASSGLIITPFSMPPVDDKNSGGEASKEAMDAYRPGSLDF